MKILGIDVGIHWSFWGFVALIVGPELLRFNPSGIVWNSFVALMIFVLIVGHEFAHALTARHYGYETKSITMHILGGVAMINMARIKPMEEFWVSFAGPLFNMGLFVLCMIPIMLGVPGLLETSVDGAATFTLLGDSVATFAGLNLLIGGFNLIPAYPMDGGRMLRALLSKHSATFATKVSHTVSSVCALGFFVVGIYMWAPIMSILGLIILFLVWAERKGTDRF